MIEQNVQVVACQDQCIRVRMGPLNGCSACDDGNGCGAGLFVKLLCRKPVVLELDRNESDIAPGQMVTLGLPEEVFIRLVFVSYGWPLLAGLAGAFLGFQLATWQQFNHGLTDAVTLLAALLSSAYVMRLIKGRNTTQTILKSLHATNYRPAVSRHGCCSTVNNPQQP